MTQAGLTRTLIRYASYVVLALGFLYAFAGLLTMTEMGSFTQGGAPLMMVKVWILVLPLVQLCLVVAKRYALSIAVAFLTAILLILWMG